jgi:AmmeMemoRadiSam system protein B
LHDHDLRGYDSEQRALLVSANGNNSLIWKPRQTTDGLIASAAAGLGVDTQFAAIHTLSIASTLPDIQVSQTPICENIDQPRLPAVAGQFYPASDDERIDMVRTYLTKAQANDSSKKKERALAIMVPHAGLIYSGGIAAKVWNSIDIPQSVLIIGPKHTPFGVNWAISPHSEWKLSSTASLMSDTKLTHLISQRLHAMQLDAAAHRREHCIEVELPFVHYLAPKSKIAAIAMASSDWPHIARAARELAVMLRELPEMPLLVISSDMNHFANDAETRRRDALALEAFASGDPQRLLSVCQQNQISMCGQIPAALVLQTLIELNTPVKIENIAYGTSADISGDKSRVVGYAGAIIWPN